MPNSWICVDANLVIRLVADPNDTVIHQLWEQWEITNQHLIAPALLHYEVTNGLYRYHKQGLMSASSAQSALEAALTLPLQLYSESDLHRYALDLATRFSLPAAYDAHYLVLAERLGAELWTSDRRLAHSVQSSLPWVHLVEQ
jgi:predicted nucleic acid-binding protein